MFGIIRFHHQVFLGWKRGGAVEKSSVFRHVGGGSRMTAFFPETAGEFTKTYGEMYSIKILSKHSEPYSQNNPLTTTLLVFYIIIYFFWKFTLNLFMYQKTHDFLCQPCHHLSEDGIPWSLDLQLVLRATTPPRVLEARFTGLERMPRGVTSSASLKHF